jgi:hypothetical protein
VLGWLLCSEGMQPLERESQSLGNFAELRVHAGSFSLISMHLGALYSSFSLF